MSLYEHYIDKSLGLSIYNSQCELCPLHKNSENVCFPGRGKDDSKVMLIVEAPGFHEDDKKLPLQGKAGQLLRRLMVDEDIELKDIFVTHLVKCRTSDGKAPDAKHVKICKQYLDKEIELLNPKYVVTMGALTAKTMIKMKVTESHGRVKELDGIKFFPTFSPGMALMDPKKTVIIEKDISKLGRLLSGKPIEEEAKLNYKVVKTYKDFVRMIRFIKRTLVLSYDIETTGLNRFEEKITLFGIGNDKEQWILPLEYGKSRFKGKYKLQLKMMKLIVYMCRNKEMIAQNGKFDDLFLKYHYGVKPKLTHDTMLMSHLLDENTPNGLKYSVLNILHGIDYDIPTEDKKGLRFQEEPEKIYEYLGYDIYYTYLLKKKLYKDLNRDPFLPVLYNDLVMPVARAYEESESHGVYLNLDKMDKVGEDLLEDIRLCESKLNAYTKTRGVNWSSTQQVAKVLYEKLGLIPAGLTPKKKPSTSEENLKRILNQHKAIPVLILHRKKKKLYDGFIKGWNIRRVGNYIYPNYKVCGTVTGRPSCKDPNLQQVPRESTIRSLVSAPPGWTFFEADYSQIELRIAALLSQESNMLSIYQSGGDIHTTTAIGITGKKEVTKEQRKSAKAVNFGFMYGMGWKGFIEYAFDKYDLVLTDKQGREFRERFFETYPGLLPWHDKQRKIVRKLGRVRTMTGRIRHLPEIYSPDQALRAQAERNAINSPVQGFAAELTLMAFAEIVETFDPRVLKPLGTIHDANVGIVRIEHQEEQLTKLKNIMESPKILRGMNIELDIPIIADVKIGDWGVGKELSFN